MTQLFSIDDLNHQDIEQIFQKAQHYLSHELAHDEVCTHLKGCTAANLFFEPSTRTLNSFALAQMRQGMLSLSPHMSQSAISKGESIEDMVHNLVQMGVKLFVVRHKDTSAMKPLCSLLKNRAHLINAGSGSQHHPSQALIDTFTILQRKNNISKLNVAIVGDIAHSRVAHSLARSLHVLGCCTITTIAPAPWQSQFINSQQASSLEALEDQDVVVCLRVQKERLENLEDFDVDHYRSHYQINDATLKKAKPDAIVLHPGPINRGIEISSSVADGPQSMILTQVSHSVAIRMAIINHLFAI